MGWIDNIEPIDKHAEQEVDPIVIYGLSGFGVIDNGVIVTTQVKP